MSDKMVLVRAGDLNRLAQRLLVEPTRQFVREDIIDIASGPAHVCQSEKGPSREALMELLVRSTIYFDATLRGSGSEVRLMEALARCERESKESL